jgi:hypothetical protein
MEGRGGKDKKKKVIETSEGWRESQLPAEGSYFVGEKGAQTETAQKIDECVIELDQRNVKREDYVESPVA